MPPLRVEYAKSSRSTCALKECSKPIEKNALRIGTGAMMPGADEVRYKWRHVCCFTKRQLAGAGSVDNIEGYDLIAEADQAIIRDMVAGRLVGDARYMQASAAATAGTAAGSPAPAGRAAAPEAPSPAPVTTAVVAPATSTTTQAVERVGGKPVCRFGTLCFRQDPRHFAEFHHRTDE